MSASVDEQAFPYVSLKALALTQAAAKCGLTRISPVPRLKIGGCGPKSVLTKRRSTGLTGAKLANAPSDGFAPVGTGAPSGPLLPRNSGRCAMPDWRIGEAPFPDASAVCQPLRPIFCFRLIHRNRGAGMAFNRFRWVSPYGGLWAQGNYEGKRSRPIWHATPGGGLGACRSGCTISPTYGRGGVV
jgi:hypothetical protein